MSMMVFYRIFYRASATYLEDMSRTAPNIGIGHI